MIDAAVLVLAPAGLTAAVWGVTSRIRRTDCVPPRPARAGVRRALPAPVVTGEVIHTVTVEVVRPPALVAAVSPVVPGE